MKIVSASKYDAIDIYLWRNDAQTKKMSGGVESIELSKHMIWMKNVLLNSSEKIFIGIEDKIKIGVCRFSFNAIDGNAEVSINLNPSMRNKGLSSVFLKLSMNEYFANKKIDLIAKIKKENLASIKCFQKSGFSIKSESEEYYHLIYGIKKEC